MTPKQARGQLRQIAKELLPEVMGSELFSAIQAENTKRLNEIYSLISKQLADIDNRTKNAYSMILRDLNSNIQVAPKPETNDEQQG